MSCVRSWLLAARVRTQGMHASKAVAVARPLRRGVGTRCAANAPRILAFEDTYDIADILTSGTHPYPPTAGAPAGAAGPKP